MKYIRFGDASSTLSQAASCGFRAFLPSLLKLPLALRSDDFENLREATAFFENTLKLWQRKDVLLRRILLGSSLLTCAGLAALAIYFPDLFTLGPETWALQLSALLLHAGVLPFVIYYFSVSPLLRLNLTILPAIQEELKNYFLEQKPAQAFIETAKRLSALSLKKETALLKKEQDFIQKQEEKGERLSVVFLQNLKEKSRENELRRQILETAERISRQYEELLQQALNEIQALKYIHRER